MVKSFQKLNKQPNFLKNSVAKFDRFSPFFTKKRNFRKLRLIRVARRSIKPLFLPLEKSGSFKISFSKTNPSYFYISPRYRQNFVVDLRTLHFEKKRKQSVTLTDIKFFPFYGSFPPSISIKYKFFRRRRYTYRFYERNLVRSRSKPFLSFSKMLKSSHYHIHLFQTKNNLFFLIKLSSGRLISSYTNGQTFYKGSKRFTPAAAELAGKNISRLAYINKIRAVFLIFHGPLTSIVKAAVRGLSSRLSFFGIKVFNARCHNGMRDRATRRV